MCFFLKSTLSFMAPLLSFPAGLMTKVPGQIKDWNTFMWFEKEKNYQKKAAYLKNKTKKTPTFGSTARVAVWGIVRCGTFVFALSRLVRLIQAGVLHHSCALPKVRQQIIIGLTSFENQRMPYLRPPSLTSCCEKTRASWIHRSCQANENTGTLLNSGNRINQ